MAIRQKSFESVAEDIKSSYGKRYYEICSAQTNEKVEPGTEGSIFYSLEEKEKMFAENYKLIYHIANRYVIKGGIERDELYHSGLLGMVKALNTYDKNLGEAKFSTYAIRCIQNEILYFMRRERKHREDHEGNYLHHLEDSLKVDENGKPFEKGDTIEDKTLPDPNYNVYTSELYDSIMKLLDRTMNENEKFILIKRHGLGPNPQELTQKEIAEILDMSQANVSKLQKNAEDRLYRYLVGVTGDKNLTIADAKEKIGGLNYHKKDALSRLQKKTQKRRDALK